MILILLVLTIAIPISQCHREKHRRHKHWRHRSEDSKDDSKGDDSEIERYLRDLCSDTTKSEECWKIIKSEIARFTGTNSRDVVAVVVDLAIEKSGEINDQLSRLHHDSDNDALKEKYILCSKNYNDANRNLVVVRRNLDSDDFGGISTEVDDAAEELKSCEYEFRGESFDSAHIKDRNKEFGHYLEIVKTTADRFLRARDN